MRTDRKLYPCGISWFVPLLWSTLQPITKVFWQRESEMKHLLYQDYISKAQHHNKNHDEVPSLEPSQSRKDISQTAKDLYARQKYSTRIGSLIPESRQALSTTKYQWLEMARKSNMGAPTAMTTVVSNARTSEIKTHVLHGACAQPDPEIMLQSLLRPGQASIMHISAVRHWILM